MRNKESERTLLNGGTTFIFSSEIYRVLIFHRVAIGFLFLIFFSSCSVQKQISRSAKLVINDSALQTAHVGISIYEPATGKYWYDHDGNKYFVPASNTKIPTCYAAMKYLGDSLVGLRWQNFNDSAINIFATGDPTFLHKDFKSSPVFDFLKSEKRNIYLSAKWEEDALGFGWAWDDYTSDYMAERSPFPVSGNTVKIKLESYRYQRYGNDFRSVKLGWQTTPACFKGYIDSVYILPLRIAAQKIMQDSSYQKKALISFSLDRARTGNNFVLNPGSTVFSQIETPFYTDGLNTAVEILKNDYAIDKMKAGQLNDNALYGETPSYLIFHIIHSQPTDSLLKPMMHRSDNFFAEQSLLMVSNEHLGLMDDARIIDTLLKTDFKDLPQKPRWVDGSGLSRYNLFTPQDFVYIFNKIKDEFGIDRIKNILPTGGEGTLSNYYIPEKGYIYAKTGSLTGVLSLSGYLYTKKNKLLIFSVLVNNHRASPTVIRRAIEKFLRQIRNKY